MFKKMKLVVKYLLVVFVFFALGWATYQFFGYHCNHGGVDLRDELAYYGKKSRIERLMNDQEAFSSFDAMSYDFSNMVDLIDLSRKVKQEGTISFDPLIKRKEIDVELVSALLTQLSKERSKLRSYILDLKGHSRIEIPFKKERTLQHYLYVIDDAMINMKELLQKHSTKKNLN
jgi:hypothetical protein